MPLFVFTPTAAITLIGIRLQPTGCGCRLTFPPSQSQPFSGKEQSDGNVDPAANRTRRKQARARVVAARNMGPAPLPGDAGRRVAAATPRRADSRRDSPAGRAVSQQ